MSAGFDVELLIRIAALFCLSPETTAHMLVQCELLQSLGATLILCTDDPDNTTDLGRQPQKQGPFDCPSEYLETVKCNGLSPRIGRASRHRLGDAQML